MRQLFKVLLLLISLTLIQCSSDENTPTSELFYNGEVFKTGNGGAYNTIPAESAGGIWLNVRESGTENPKNILVVAYHEPGSHSGTYTLRNNLAGNGIANVVVMDDEGNQLVGGSVNGPTGTVTILDHGNNRFNITFNDVVLDVDTSDQTTISGNVHKTFTPTGN